MSDEQKKDESKKSAKIEVEILRRCSNEDGDEFDAGDITKLPRKLALIFIDNGVCKPVV